MRSRIVLLTTLLAACSWLGACRTSPLDATWGDAHAENASRMTLHPNASHPAPDGLDSRTAKSVMDGYYKNQKQARAPQVGVPSIIQIDAN